MLVIVNDHHVCSYSVPTAVRGLGPNDVGGLVKMENCHGGQRRPSLPIAVVSVYTTIQVGMPPYTSVFAEDLMPGDRANAIPDASPLRPMQAISRGDVKGSS
jgi:hypothetical protein